MSKRFAILAMLCMSSVVMLSACGNIVVVTATPALSTTVVPTATLVSNPKTVVAFQYPTEKPTSTPAPTAPLLAAATPKATFTPIAPTNTLLPRPTNTAVPTVKATPVPVNSGDAAFANLSRGVGLTKAQWEQLEGPPNQQYHPTDTQAAYQGNRFLVMYLQGKVWTLTIQFEQTPMTMHDATALALSYLPTDTKYQKKYIDSTSGETVYVYKSESIVSRFTNDALTWTTDATRGQILVFFLPDQNNPNTILDLDIIVGAEEDLGN